MELPLGMTVLGRDSGCDLVLEHESVSTQHCQIEIGEEKVVIEDLDSTNGTFVGETRIEKARLENGSTIRVGDLALRFEDADRIVVPEKVVSREPESIVFDDGTPACAVYPDQPAEAVCRKCQKHFSAAALRRVGLQGKKSRVLWFGGSCRGPCDIVGWVPPEAEKVGLLGRLKSWFGR